MKKILVPIKAKLKPPEVNEELKNFKQIHKSPYSQTYYDTSDISWEHKPEESLRISDHWNFYSQGQKHCELSNIEDYIENYWILAKYKNGKYHMLKEFGPGVDGYLYISINKMQIETLKNLDKLGGVEATHIWYKNNTIKPPFTREGHLKQVKKLHQHISIERLRRFKIKKPKAKKIIFIEDKYINEVKTILSIYEKSMELSELANTDEGKSKLFREYNAYEIIKEKEESFEKIYTLVSKDNIAIDTLLILELKYI